MDQNAGFKPAAALPPPIPMSAMQGRCCCGDNGEHYTLSRGTSGGQMQSLTVKGDQLILGSSESAASFTRTLVEPGKVRLSVDGKNVAVINGAVRLSDKEQTLFYLDPGQSGQISGYTLRTQDGYWLSVSKVGDPLSLTKTVGPEMTFRFELAPKKIAAHWAADEGHAFDEARNTHLWIFKRACDLIYNRKNFGGAGPQQDPSLWSQDERASAMWCLSFSAARINIMRGIYDADNLGGNLPGGNPEAWVPASNPHTTALVYSAHFWNFISQEGGWWDLRKKENNAYKFGTFYWQKAVDELDPAMSGYYLGLAIHYLEDLTQPMHCGLFGNGVGESGPPNADDSRHAKYESWALTMQDRCAGEFDSGMSSIPVVRPNYIKDPGKYWQIAGERGLNMYGGWKKSPGSPIDEKWIHDTPNENNVPSWWLENLSVMLKLAQRLVANLLVSYALFSKIGQGRGKVSPTDVVLLSTMHGDVAVGPEAWRQGNADGNVAYSTWIDATSAGSVWALEPVLQNGTVVLENGNPVYYIRNKGTNRCIVAPENTDDGNIYYQDPGGRSCAEWVLETTGASYLRKKDNRRYPTFRLRDRKWHNRYLIGSSHPGTSGPLKHGDATPEKTLNGQWIQVPAEQWART